MICQFCIASKAMHFIYLDLKSWLWVESLAIYLYIIFAYRLQLDFTKDSEFKLPYLQHATVYYILTPSVFLGISYHDSKPIL